MNSITSWEQIGGRLREILEAWKAIKLLLPETPSTNSLREMRKEFVDNAYKLQQPYTAFAIWYMLSDRKPSYAYGPHTTFQSGLNFLAAKTSATGRCSVDFGVTSLPFSHGMQFNGSVEYFAKVLLDLLAESWQSSDESLLLAYLTFLDKGEEIVKKCIDLWVASAPEA